MNQKQRTLVQLGVAVLVAGALAGLAFKTGRDEEAKAASDEKAALLNTFDTTRVDWVKVNAKGETTELRKTGTTWEITEPLHADVDVGVLDGLLGRLSELKTKSKVEDAATDLAKYGLAKPHAEVWAKGQGIDVDVLFGDANAYNYSEYVKRGADQAVYLAEGENAALEKNTFDLRDKRVHPFDPSSATGLQVTLPDGGAYSLAKTGEGWRLKEPVPERADDTVVGQILATLAGLRASAIPEEKVADLAKYGLDAPSRTATVTGRGPPLTFLFGVPKGRERIELFAKATPGDAVYKLLTNAVDVLQQSPEMLEDKVIARFETSEVAAMTFTIPGGATILVQKRRQLADAGSGPDTWSQLSPKTGEGKAWKIGSLMHNLAGLRAVKVVGSPSDLKPYGLDAPQHTVKVQNGVGEALVELDVGSGEGANFYVKVAHDPRVFEVEKYKLGSLPEGPDDLLMIPQDGGEGEP